MISAGVEGESTNGIGVYGDDTGSGNGLYGISATGIGVYGATFGTDQKTGGTIVAAVMGQSTNAIAVYGNEAGTGMAVFGEALTANATAIEGSSKGGTAVFGDDGGSGTGVHASSNSGYGLYADSISGLAAYFAGNVFVSGVLSVNGVIVASDRNLKSNFAQVDGGVLLTQIDALPITSWDYKTTPNERHIGPMAQDFHAAFGLNGADDTHISEVDIVGVSLAAIQELNREIKQEDMQLRQRDSEIAELKAQTAAQAMQLQAQAKQVQTLSDMAASFSARMTALESQRGVATQTVALKDLPVGRSGANE